MNPARRECVSAEPVSHDELEAAALSLPTGASYDDLDSAGQEALRAHWDHLGEQRIAQLDYTKTLPGPWAEADEHGNLVMRETGTNDRPSA